MHYICYRIYARSALSYGLLSAVGQCSGLQHCMEIAFAAADQSLSNSQLTAACLGHPACSKQAYGVFSC